MEEHANQRNSRSSAPGWMRDRALWGLIATPLASIFGSGFLIIVPVVSLVMGVNAPWGVLAVCLYSIAVGAAIRATILRVEAVPINQLPRIARVSTALSTPVVVVAYVTSVALYLRVLAAYALHASGVSSDQLERGLASVLVLLIVVVGVTRGFRGLERVEQWMLYATLAVGSLVPIACTAYMLMHPSLVSGAFVQVRAPSMPSVHTLAVLGGVLITVQGFETVRFLGDEYPASQRITAMRVAQAVALIAYAGLAFTATPLLHALRIPATGQSLLDLMDHTVPLLVIPLVLVAVGSQMSAAIADTVTAVDGSHNLPYINIGKQTLYLVSGICVVGLIFVTDLFQLVTVASQAFAAYYALAAVEAAATSPRRVVAVCYFLLALSLAAIVVFAQPASL